MKITKVFLNYKKPPPVRVVVVSDFVGESVYGRETT